MRLPTWFHWLRFGLTVLLWAPIIVLFAQYDWKAGLCGLLSSVAVMGIISMDQAEKDYKKKGGD